MASVEPVECDIIATLSPRQGKLERVRRQHLENWTMLTAPGQVVELLTNLTDVVKNKEPGVFSYRLYQEFDHTTGEGDLILVEK